MNNVTFRNLAEIIINDFDEGGLYLEMARKAYVIGVFCSLEHDCILNESFFSDFLWYLCCNDLSFFYMAGILKMPFDFDKLMLLKIKSESEDKNLC